MASDDNIIQFPEFFRLPPDAQKRMRSVIRWYKLDEGHTPIRVKTARGHLEALAKHHTAIDETGVDPWNVGRTTIGEVTVSTAFLGLDHNRLGRGTPILFQTMIFGADGDSLHQNRCSTWEQAEAMHAEAVAKMRSLKVVK
jgi:hypothetical protein